MVKKKLFWIVALILLLRALWEGTPPRHKAYARYVARHKAYVGFYALELGLPLWVAIFHDWDKLLPSEWFPYARAFYKEDGSGQYKPDHDFTLAWLQHQNINKHHWQYWVMIWDRGNLDPQPMPDRYRREMLADWRGAGAALGKPDTLAWYTDNRPKMLVFLHPETLAWLDEQLGYQHPVISQAEADAAFIEFASAEEDI